MRKDRQACRIASDGQYTNAGQWAKILQARVLDNCELHVHATRCKPRGQQSLKT